ncbi:MAG TPA: ATP-binding protein, partial [Myxococcota bacterium]|nr:ATP-binding protein [Myxococcota bacterium]
MLFESSSLAKWIMHAETGAFLAVNSQAILQFGHSRETFLRMTVHDLAGAGGAASQEESMRALRISGASSRWVVQRDGPDGRTAWIETRCQRARFVGQPAFLVSLQEVTVPEAETASRAAGLQLDRFFAFSADVMCITDTRGAIIRANPACREFLGLSEREVVDASFWRHVHADDLPDFQAKVQGLLNTRDVKSGVSRMHHASGALVSVAWSVTLGDDGFLYINARDVSRQRELEDELRQAQKMEAIGRLAGGVAHDFNNMLSVIMGIGGCLVRELPADSPVRADVQEMVAAGRRASNLTQQLLAFSRKQLLQPRVLCVNDLVKEVERMLRHIIAANIAFRVCLPNEPVYVRVDAGQLQQCIVNLVLNARDAMPHGGELTLSLGLSHLYQRLHNEASGLPTGMYARLGVTDTGDGMDAAVVARVFEPFFTTKEAAKGTGLGLSSVLGIVQQSGGDVLVRSVVARGTTFEVLLPAVAAPPEASRLVPDRGASGASDRQRVILVVEDEPMVRELVIRVLAEADYQVLEAPGSEEAVAVAEAFGARPIDLLLTDVMMPRVTGPQLAERLTASRPGLKVMYMSGYTSDSF